MTSIHAVVLGIVEGITEYLPISSTAHLIITSKILNLPQTEYQKFFEVFIQSGAIFAVVYLYLQYLVSHKEVIKKVAVSFIPTALIGFLLYKVIKNVFFQSYYLMIFSLIVIGGLFIVVELLIKNKTIVLKKTINNLSFTEALIIGLNQSLAVIPGVSRAGIVLLAMMIMGYCRDEAAEYSFLLAVPTILGASFFDLIKTDFAVISNGNHFLMLVVGLITSFITAYFAVKWLIHYLKNNSLIWFGIYRVVLAIILLQIVK